MINFEHNKRRGFTLIELMVVVAIIGMLTGLVSFNFQQARMRARDVQRKSELAAIRDALEMYKNDQLPQTFPATGSLETTLIPNYIKEIPIDPIEKSSDGSWFDYVYTKGVGLDYTLQTCLENKSDTDAKKEAGGDAVTCLGGEGVIYEIKP